MEEDGHSETQSALIVEESVEAPIEQLPSASHSHRAKGGTRWLVGGAWTLLVIQVLAIAGYLIHGHVRDPAIDTFLLAPSSHSVTVTLGILIGTTLPGMAAFAGGLSLHRRTDPRRGKGLSSLAALSVVAMVGLQVMPTFSHAGGWGLSSPSSRLVGHWGSDNDPFWSDVEYGPMDSVGMGTCHGPDGSVLFTFQILSEDRPGTRLVVREYLDRIALYDVEYCVSIDGCSMTKEYVTESGTRMLSKYRRVDANQKSQALQGMQPLTPAESASPSQTSDSAWNPASEFPPPLEVYAIVNVGGKRTASVRMDDSRYTLHDLVEGSFVDGWELVPTNGSDVGTFTSFVTAWKVRYMDSRQIAVEKQGRTWVHRVGDRSWELIADSTPRDNATESP